MDDYNYLSKFPMDTYAGAAFGNVVESESVIGNRNGVEGTPNDIITINEYNM
jgi:hypothetical protein